MKRLLIIFLMSCVQDVCAMQFPITAEIKKNMKELYPLTLNPSDSKPRVEDCRAPGRILIAREDIVFGKYRYYRFETNEQVDQLVNQIPEETMMQSGEICKIEWFYYDPPITSVDDDEYEDAHD